MKELFTLFIVFFFFVLLSIVAGAGVWLVEPAYAKEVTGSFLILTSLFIAVQFFNEFGRKA